MNICSKSPPKPQLLNKILPKIIKKSSKKDRNKYSELRHRLQSKTIDLDDSRNRGALAFTQREHLTNQQRVRVF
jgi:hypothetical protein